MKGFLVVAHGSRAKESEAALESVMAVVKQRLPDAAVEWAFMGFSERTVEKGVCSLVARGVTEIKIVPYVLFMGIHMKESLPQLAAECAAGFPGVKIEIGEPLGLDMRLADILADRIK
ncbi:MAG: CbiX/SirB N-terminal domain-containing protein [Clostridiales bacterium]|nr:CbiX/SirB N-terminal domain-containing protein [Clostridiales bacterium]